MEEGACGYAFGCTQEILLKVRDARGLHCREVSPAFLCVKSGLVPREKDVPRAGGRVCSAYALWCGSTRNMEANLIQPEQIEQVILLIRGQRVMLDRDLAALYDVTTGNLNKAVQRNPERFPPDFMFQLTADEAEALRFILEA